MSTTVERVFSQGRQLLSFTRNRHSGDSICSHLCLGLWCRNNIISVKDIMGSLGIKAAKPVEPKSLVV